MLNSTRVMNITEKEGCHFATSGFYGDLSMDEIFTVYEEPLLFSCKDTANALYLLNLLSVDKKMNEYMIVPVTKRRIEEMRSNQIDIRTLFTEQAAHAQTLVVDETGYATNKPVLMIDENLPDEGIYLVI